jgi:hypothetical protein
MENIMMKMTRLRSITFSLHWDEFGSADFGEFGVTNETNGTRCDDGANSTQLKSRNLFVHKPEGPLFE